MRKLFVSLVLVVGLVVGGCDPAEEGPGAGIQLIGLVTEDSCDELLGWFQKEASAQVDQFAGYWRGGDMPAAGVAIEDGRADATAGAESAAAAPSSAERVAGDDYSTTNVQEAGVDEPDVVKTDGKRLVAVAGAHLRFVDVTGAAPALRASLPLAGVQQVFLTGDRVLAFGSEWTAYPMAMADRASARGIASPVPGDHAPKTRVTVIDIADLARPNVVATLDLEGSYVSARLVDGVARLVLRSTPAGALEAFTYPRFPGAEEQQRAIDANREAIESSTLDDWLPSYVYAEPGNRDAKVEGRQAECAQVHHPRDFTGMSMVSVIPIDPQDPRPGNAAVVAGAGETVYASTDRLWVSSSRWWAGGEPETGEAAAEVTTELHAFDITDKVTTRYAGSGSILGTLLNQFSLSEHKGVLRVASTRQDMRTGQTESQVVALRFDGSELKQIGSLGGLGKTERIYAVRFLGDLGYVVTFRQTDPLYVIDLSNPEQPALKGELKIPGYSAYLHPIGDGRLLGIGQNATDQGRRLGAQLSLFDVRDPANPRQLATHDLSSYSSMAEYDHHAFLWWAKKSLAVVPVEGMRRGAVGVAVDGDGLVERGGLEHPTGMPIARSLVVGDSLLTMSDSGLLTSDLDRLSTRSWLPF